MENINFFVPIALRKKYISSRISHEIFFIDSINDLSNCVKSKTSYDLIRFSALLRMLLLDGGLKTISKNYNFDIQLFSNREQISGKPLTDKETRNIKDELCVTSLHDSKIYYLELSHEPLKAYSLEEFIEKICLKIQREKEYNFSVANVIKIIANKHGASHLESTFDSSSFDTFFMGNFSPFSMKEGNFFLEKIEEIIFILIAGVIPLCFEIVKNLEKYDKENIQAENSSFAYLMSFEDYEKLKEKS